MFSSLQLVAFQGNEEHVNAPDVEEENLSDLELDLGDLNLDEEDKNPGPSRDPSSAKPIFGYVQQLTVLIYVIVSLISSKRKIH